jgi:predicted metal-dependent phosphoesterase TrpH
MELKIFADLHNHTTASDGDFLPEKLVKKAKELGIKALGITDHDTLNGLSKALDAGDNNNIQVIPGVEVSIRFKRPYFTGTLHLLCYFSRQRLADEIFVRDFESILARGRGEGLVRDRVDQINFQFGPNGESPLLKRNLLFQDIAEYSSNATRRHFALALAEKLGIKDKDTINGIIGNKSPAYLPSGIDLDQGATLIQKLKLTAVLAHPGAGSFPGKGHYKEVLPPIDVVERILPEFIKAGIQGIEVYYPGHTEEHRQVLLSWAKTHGLFVTGGSDCHDAIERPPGVSGLSESEFNIFKEAIP